MPIPFIILAALGAIWLILPEPKVKEKPIRSDHWTVVIKHKDPEGVTYHAVEGESTWK